ncbi:hypothetical protein VTN00DRAFT_9931 [Thermoascus crustaceus]|uniref:uncharacterized protein n=1 Tax=Thermoascus crustaceus TaxID=5088 RepID=UPI003742CD44
MAALQSFTYLSENLPSWIARVSDLATHTASKHAEFSEEYKKLSHPVKPRRRKNSSVHSLRPSDMNQKPPSVKNEHATEEQPADLANNKNDAPAGNRRKRTTDEAPSMKTADGPQVIRTRYNVVISYDGHTQNVLEAAVRDIGSARNNIRRDKLTRIIKPGFAMEMFSRSVAMSNDDSSSQVLGMVSGRYTRDVNKGTPLDYVDKQLELAQGLCETAAHQFLRYGDCSKELEGVQEKFRILLEMANAEVERMKEEQKQMEATRAEEPAPKKEREVKPEPPKPVSISEPAENGKPPEPASSAIEVDDASSTSSISIDMTAFRTAKFRP